MLPEWKWRRGHMSPYIREVAWFATCRIFGRQHIKKRPELPHRRRGAESVCKYLSAVQIRRRMTCRRKLHRSKRRSLGAGWPKLDANRESLLVIGPRVTLQAEPTHVVAALTLVLRLVAGLAIVSETDRPALVITGLGTRGYVDALPAVAL